MRLVPIVTAAILAASSVPADASGGLGCEAKDASVSFEVDAGVTRGMGGPFLNFRATLAVAIDRVPDDLRELTLDDALTHSWLDGEEVKLQFYVERQEGDFASVDFVIEAMMVEEGLYRGGYVLNVFSSETPYAPEPVETSAAGEVICYVE
jgi:hypothetical protein